MLKCGIVGLPLSGKTTIFNVITKAGAEVKPYASGKTEPNRAVVPVPDVRFDHLVELFEPKKETPATVEFVDLAGISRDASKGAGLGNAFLSFVGESDALIHVVRCFENPDVPHPEDSIDPCRDWEIVEMELILRDLDVTENRLSRLAEKKKLKTEEMEEKATLEKCVAHLIEERPLRDLELDPEEIKSLSGFAFLTLKPELLVLNIDENQTTDDSIPEMDRLKELILQKDLKMVKVFGSIEMEMAELEPQEQKEFMDDLGITEPGRDRLISQAHSMLGLISFFTTGKDEVKAWTLKNGATAVDAAGTIHSDLARGFIRAQVVHYEDFLDHQNSFAHCRESGKLRLEGKDYIVQDGDMIEIRFNV
ncbi:MAG: redox-regulated ATPase YchF [Synergistales bacterium]|nr:redox-regulated ATPase YchF [Synergistales bacterium]